MEAAGMPQNFNSQQAFSTLVSPPVNDVTATAELLSGEFEGREIGSNISVIRVSTDAVGTGPRLHKHPYREIFLIQRGRALFTVGEEHREGRAGDVLVVPAEAPHKFSVLGPDTYEAVDIHESDHFITDWLE